MMATMTAFPPPVTPYLPVIAVHISSGCLGILTGYAAVSVKKGEKLHRAFGTVFVGAMLIMASVATFLAISLRGQLPGQEGNIAGGTFALYLVTTGWLAARRADGRVGTFEKAAAVVVLCVGLVFLGWGALAAASPKHMLDGYSAVFYYVFGGIAMLMAALDFKVILKGSIAGASRIARHLWRMCFAFFFATGSFFLGQQKIMPLWMHGSLVLLALGTAPLGFMVFWLIRVKLTKWWRADVPARSAPGAQLVEAIHA
jgi:uncharacterized membrane protein